MKTVIDVVNEHQGVWPACYIGSITCDNGKELICTREQFNQCVDEMSRHATDELYERYVRAKKSPLVKMINDDMKPVRPPRFFQEFRVLGGDNEVWQKCKIVFKGKRYTVVENENGKEFSRKTANIFIRDIDTRTDTEKCGSDLDKLGYLCNVSLINSIKAGKIHGVTFTGES
ncbi:MAG: hypothetical protein HRU18_00790 [Pseudoalteromonas sp.]|uniref:hypothetical protein n=1 Tax=Pseudoalteromonas sp. TaxID=53249 RepID=UPI001DDAE27B|nr:hypothetical protein [Pseudoalteromonas sp.]NRA76716.1 hypothetical protein [Pseudoalteromonas sp.]